MDMSTQAHEDGLATQSLFLLQTLNHCTHHCQRDRHCPQEPPGNTGSPGLNLHACKHQHPRP